MFPKLDLNPEFQIDRTTNSHVIHIIMKERRKKLKKTPIVVFYIGLCSFSITLSSDLEANLRGTDMKVTALEPVVFTSIEERIAIKTIYFNNIKFHCVARELSVLVFHLLHSFTSGNDRFFCCCFFSFVNRFLNIFRALMMFILLVVSIAFCGFLLNINVVRVKIQYYMISRCNLK